MGGDYTYITSYDVSLQRNHVLHTSTFLVLFFLNNSQMKFVLSGPLVPLCEKITTFMRYSVSFLNI